MENQKKMTYNIDINIKDIMIIILFISLGWFVYKYMNSDVDTLKENIDQRDKENEKLQTERDSLEDALNPINQDILKYRNQYKLDSLKSLDLLEKMEDLEKDKIGLKKTIKYYEGSLSEANKRIEELEKNPVIIPKKEILKKITEKFN